MFFSIPAEETCHLLKSDNTYCLGADLCRWMGLTGIELVAMIHSKDPVSDAWCHRQKQKWRGYAAIHIACRGLHEWREAL